MKTKYKLSFKWNDEKIVIIDESYKNLFQTLSNEFDYNIKNVEHWFIQYKLRVKKEKVTDESIFKTYKELSNEDYDHIINMYFYDKSIVLLSGEIEMN